MDVRLAYDRELVAEIARRYLTADLVALWRRLLRSTAAVRQAVPGVQAAEVLSGPPSLPDDTDWPSRPSRPGPPPIGRLPAAIAGLNVYPTAPQSISFQMYPHVIALAQGRDNRHQLSPTRQSGTSHAHRMVHGCDAARDHGSKGGKTADQDQKRETY
jgi:hypothetical protein